MKYLKKVTLKNFQSHKHSIIEFNQGLNIIVGPSDSGKSAIIRGIKWALYNEPSGDYFIREGEKEACVTLEFSNNLRIQRLRSKSKNAYIIINNNDDEIIFEGFGNKVPQEVIDLIGIEKVPLDTNESNAINLGEQLEGAFLLSEKGSTRASAIGRLVGVNLIDDALKDTLKDVRNLSIQKKTISENIKNIEEELKTYEYLDGLKENIVSLEDNRNSIKDKSDMKNKLIDILKEYNAIQTGYIEINNLLNNLDFINRLESNMYKLENKSRQLIVYKSLQNRLNESKRLLYYNNNLVNQLVNNDIIESRIFEIEKLMSNISVLKTINIKLSDYKNKISNTYKSIESLRSLDEINISVDYLEKKIKRLKELLIVQEKKIILDKRINMGRDYLKNLQSLDKLDMVFKDLDNLTKRTDQVLVFSKRLQTIKLEIKEQNDILISCKKNIDNNLNEYEELLKKNETCPFCLSNINEEKIEHIIQHYS